VEHELGDPDAVHYGGASTHGEDVGPDVADLPGGLYDDAVVSEDAPGIDEDFAVSELEAEFDLVDGADLDAKTELDVATGLDDGAGLADAAGLDDEAGVDDGAGVVAELDIDGSLLDAIEQELADVERALAMLDDGTYGQCEHCNGVIGDDVLARTPTARFCAEHLPLALR
jgi:hypothetical protein